MAEKYLQDDEKEQLKSKLHAYLADKAKRRARVTSKPYYDQADKEFAHQERVADFGALGGLLLNSGDRAGTVLGRGPQSNFQQFSEGLDGSRQQRINNMKGVRDLEERSNMNDLNVAQYLSGVDQFDDNKKLRREEMALRGQEATDSREMRLEMLRAQLGDRAAARQMGEQRFGLDTRKQDENERANRAREKLMGEGKVGAAGPNWSPAATGDEGILYVNPKDPTQQRIVPVPKNFKPKGAKDEASEKITDGQWKAAQFADRMQRSSSKIEEIIGQGYDPSEAIGAIRRKQPVQSLRSPQDQIFLREMLEFGAAVLRDETGAAFSDAEKIDVAQRYFPGYGDDKGTVERKRVARDQLIDGLRAEGETAYGKIGATRARREGGAQPPPGAPAAPGAPSSKRPEDMSSEERKAELDRLRKSVGGG